jgi:hypothetical protein
VILGGCVLHKESFIRLEQQWSKMLSAYRVNSLHMADFVRLTGRYIGVHRFEIQNEGQGDEYILLCWIEEISATEEVMGL